MKVRSAVAVLLAAVGGLGAAVAAGAEDHNGARATSTVPRDQRTHPRVRPHFGDSSTTFVLRFRLRQTPGHQGVMETSYNVQVAPHRRAADACWPDQPPPVTSGHQGQLVRLRLKPPDGGWCTGRFHVTVFLERGPYCPPSQDGQPRPCPEFATQEADTGETHFTVH
ncbi:MAG: hypothetical protein ACJ764_05990 [Solirubrobacteraceae bacterium]